MKIKLLIIIALLLTGCGSTGAALSAPGAGPVDLPAPVVGRIDVGTPDATGKSTITGTAGAVEPGAIVMAINERLEVSSALWKVTDALFAKAYAQTLPSICSAAGHVCVIAGADGSLVIEIDAIIGDSIVLVLLSSDGEEISPRITFAVPAFDSTSTDPSDPSDPGDPVVVKANCSGQGVVGTIKGVVDVEGVPLILHDGDEENTITLEVSPLLTIDLPGCTCGRLMVVPTGGTNGVIVAELEDGQLWSASWDGLTNLVGARLAIPAEQILHMEPMGDPDYLAVAFQNAAGFAIGRLSLVDGTIGNVLSVPTILGYTHQAITSVSAYGPFKNNVYLGVALIESQVGTATEYFTLFFETYEFSAASGMLNISAIFPAPYPRDIADAKLTVMNKANPLMLLTFTDQTNLKLRSLEVWEQFNQLSYHPQGDLIQILTVATIDLVTNLALDWTPNPNTLVPHTFDIGFDGDVPIAYVRVADSAYPYNLWIVNDLGNTGSPQLIEPVPGTLDPYMISASGTSVMLLDTALNEVFDGLVDTNSWQFAY